VGVTVGSFEATLGPRRFFLPIRLGGGGSHLGFCFYVDVSVCSLNGRWMEGAYFFAVFFFFFVGIGAITRTGRHS
jgi:hypothetical protein